MGRAVTTWLKRTTSQNTTDAYARDLQQFLEFHDIDPDHWEQLARIVPEDVSAWRDWLRSQSAANSTITRKLTAIRSLYSYLQIYGYTGANPAHSDFVMAPSVPRDGKTVGLSPRACRRLMDARDPETPAGIRDRAIFAVLAYTACRVDELVKLDVGDFKTDGEHRILDLHGKGDKERKTALHPEAAERLAAWLDIAGIREDRDGPLFRPAKTARGQGRDGFKPRRLTTRSVQNLVERYGLAQVQHFGQRPSAGIGDSGA